MKPGSSPLCQIAFVSVLLHNAAHMLFSYLRGSCRRCAQAAGLWSQTRGGETENSNRLASTSPCELKASLFHTLFPLREFSVSNSKTEDVKDKPDSLHAGCRLTKVRQIPASGSYSLHQETFKKNSDKKSKANMNYYKPCPWLHGSTVQLSDPE